MDEPSEARTDGADDPDLPRTSVHDALWERDEPVRRAGRIPSALLDEHALTVVRRLKRFGHEAYLVGGCVRDLLSGIEPKDFDVVTDAHPNRIKRVFRNARIIGRRFRLAHIRFGPDHVVETSTYRADPATLAESVEPPEPGDEREDGRTHIPENVFGTAPEDARRRDFTINALFYDPVEDEILDWVGGLEDHEAGVVRSIGDPVRRIREDPVRMIRAVHFAERMGFSIEPSLERAIREEAAHLENASPARLYLELIKVLNRAKARPTLHRLHEMGVLEYWLPELDRDLEADASWPESGGGTHEEASRGEPEDLPTAHATWNLLGAADRWGMAAHAAEDALALAPLLGPWLLQASILPNRRSAFHTYADRFEDTLRPMARRMSIPRRTAARLRDLLWLWREMRSLPQGRRAPRTVRRPTFLLALSFLRLDLMARDCPLDLLEQWEVLAPDAPLPRERPEARRRGRGRGRERADRGRRRGHRREVGSEEAAWTPAPTHVPKHPHAPRPASERDSGTGHAPERKEAPPPSAPPDDFAEGLE